MKFTPVAATRMSTWAGGGTGVATSSGSRTSGPPNDATRMALIASEPQLTQVLEVAAGGGQLVAGPLLLDIAGLLLDRGHRRQEALEVEHAAAQLHVLRVIGDDVLQVEAPAALAVLLEIT